MRRLAKRAIPDRLRPAVTVVDGTAEHLPLDDAWATVAWAVASFRHWTDPAAGLAEGAGFAEVTVSSHRVGRRQLAVVAGRRPADSAA
jgi:hypothetical protein